MTSLNEQFVDRFFKGHQAVNLPGKVWDAQSRKCFPVQEGSIVNHNFGLTFGLAERAMVRLPGIRHSRFVIRAQAIPCVFSFCFATFPSSLVPNFLATSLRMLPPRSRSAPWRSVKAKPR